MSMYDIGIVRRKRVTQQSSMMFGQSIAVSGFDAATLAWVAAVFAVDGTVVSTPQKTLVDNLIVGLKADGLFTKLDRLWLFAIENQTEALVDIVADQLATAVNAPGFMPNLGFAGGSPAYIESSFTPGVTSGNYTQNSACIGVWAINANVSVPRIGWLDGGLAVGGYVCANVGGGDLAGCNINSPFNHFLTSATACSFVLGSRPNSSTQTLYGDGTQLATDPAETSVGLTSGPSIWFLGRDFGGTLNQPAQEQYACGLIGGGLTSTDNTNLYSRLRTYMTAVGVP